MLGMILKASHSRHWSGLVIATACLPAMGCSIAHKADGMTPIPSTPRLAEVRLISHPPGFYGYSTWLDGSTLAVQYSAELRGVMDVGISRLDLDDGALEPIVLPKHPSCGPDGENAYEAPHRLADGRMAYFVNCRPKGEIFNTKLYLMAYDPDREEVEQLLDYPIPRNTVGTGGFAWSPDMTRGVMGDGRAYIKEQLYWFSKDVWEPIDVGLVQAYGPSWSPDGEWIAFVGSTEEGSPRTFSDYGLYLMSAEGEEVHAVVEGFHDMGGVAWSPEGRWLVFPGTFGEREGDQQGLWLFDLQDKKLRQIAGGGFGLPRWSPDGQRIAVVQFLGPVDDRVDQVTIVEVGPVLEG